MTTITATHFREYLFEYLNRIAQGETVIIRHNEEDVARISPVKQIENKVDDSIESLFGLWRDRDDIDDAWVMDGRSQWANAWDDDAN